MAFADTSAEKVVVALFEQLADRYNNRNEGEPQIPADVGLHFCLECRGDNHGYEKDGNTYRPEWERHFYSYIHIIVLSGRRVYVTEGSSQFLRDTKPEEYKNTSNHDSCWRSDGLDIINKVKFGILEQCREGIPREHMKCACDYVDVTLTPLLQRPFRWVKVTRKPIEDDRSGYFDGLNTIVEIKPKLVFAETPTEYD